jgi:hypothetical protein
MSPPSSPADRVSLAEFIEKTRGSTVLGRIVEPDYPSDRNLTLTVQQGWYTAQDSPVANGRYWLVSSAKTRILHFIETQHSEGGDTAEQKELDLMR